MKNVCLMFKISSGGSKGNARDASLSGPNSFIFVLFSANILPNSIVGLTDTPGSSTALPKQNMHGKASRLKIG